MVGLRTLRLVPQLVRILLGSIRSGRWHQVRQVAAEGLSIAFKEAGHRKVPLVGRAILDLGPPFEPTPLFQMATGYWVSQAIYVAARLGIADVLAAGPKSGQELADAHQAAMPKIWSGLPIVPCASLTARAGPTGAR